MPSPFPGMDPYLEAHWRDVHSSLIIYSRDQLQPGLPDDLFARVEERIYVESPHGEERSMYPDVRVVERGGGAAAAVAMADAAEPYVIDVGDEPVTETYIEIIDASSGNRVVSVVEFLSPSNKTAGEGHEQYRKKQSELLLGGVNLVEIDLVRAGKPAFSVSAYLIPAGIRTTYQAVVRRCSRREKAEIYRLPLQTPLPTIRIPLRPTDPDAALNLQTLIEQCYRNGRYQQTLNYQAEPDPPLSAEEASWADSLLRAAGKRK